MSDPSREIFALIQDNFIYIYGFCIIFFVGLFFFSSVLTATLIPALDSLHSFAVTLIAKGGLFSTLSGILIDPYGAGGIITVLVLLFILLFIVEISLKRIMPKNQKQDK